MKKKQTVIVGAGFWGCTIAEQIAGISINCRIFPESTLKEALARDILL